MKSNVFAVALIAIVSPWSTMAFAQSGAVTQSEITTPAPGSQSQGPGTRGAVPRAAPAAPDRETATGGNSGGARDRN